MFLDFESNGFQLESSGLRSAEMLTRLLLVFAGAMLYLVAQGTDVVANDKRRWVDPHWFRSTSYFRIGWQWVRTALSHGWELIKCLTLGGANDPEPVMASRKQHKRRSNCPVFKSMLLNFQE